MRNLGLYVGLWTLVAIVAPCHAATITTTQTQQTTLIAIEGDFKQGDEDVFAEKVLRLKDATVVLNSPGGHLFAGIEIGRAIRVKGFDTAVRDGSSCFSACALAWLAGRNRLAGPDGRIGFHAAWRLENG